jgi:hypothetical protein
MRSCYRSIYTQLNSKQRWGFVNYHVSLLLKLLLLGATIYSFCQVKLGNATFDARAHRGSFLSHGDMLVVVTHMFVAMYLHELMYRKCLSPVAIAHHTGTVVIAELAVSMTMIRADWDLANEEFRLCMIWDTCSHLQNLPTHTYSHKVHQVCSTPFAKAGCTASSS